MGPADFYQLTTRLSAFQLQYDHFDRALGKSNKNIDTLQVVRADLPGPLPRTWSQATFRLH
jgi:hypothetical protein